METGAARISPARPKRRRRLRLGVQWALPHLTACLLGCSSSATGNGGAEDSGVDASTGDAQAAGAGGQATGGAGATGGRDGGGEAAAPSGGGGGEAGAASGDASDLICTSCDGSCEETIPVTSAYHVDGGVTYTDIPPVGGNHDPCWADWGVHDTPVPPENWVHNLEHGGVVYLYACPTGCDAEVATLAAFVEGKVQALLTEYADMPPGFAAVSWGHRLVASCLDMSAMAAFYDAHIDQAPELSAAGKPSTCP
jgi:hypothetical protein